MSIFELPAPEGHDYQAEARDYQDNLKAEAESWLIPDARLRADKLRRERIRHYGLIRDLLLDKLGTDEMDILEVGGGPMPVSDLMRYRSRCVVDPLSDTYRSLFPCPDHRPMMIENFADEDCYDLVIATNSLDHVSDPHMAIDAMDASLRSGGYMAILCAQDNALTNPHPAHEHNLNAGLIHEWLDHSYETVWELNYRDHDFRYGWVLYEGKRGQPAFALLLRKCTGY